MTMLIFFQTRNPHAVQPHLRKCFDGISKLEFGVKVIGSLGDDPTAIPIGADIIFTTDIIAMLSPEGERVELIKVNIFLNKVNIGINY